MGEDNLRTKKIVFLTGTRADFGKLKSLIEICRNSTFFEVHIFATGMHMDEKYGSTVHEIEKCGYSNIYRFINHGSESLMDITLAKTIEGFAGYIRMIKPDLIVIHGDRVEALAGATVGALNNILVAHIEGGEVSGTIDELIRHAVSKLSHTHFVANEEAKARLLQMGEIRGSIYVIGSPDLDVLLSNNLPAWKDVKQYYEIPFDDFAVSIFHPVTTEIENLHLYASTYSAALETSGCNYVLIYPNNDQGSDIVLSALQKLNTQDKFRLYPSMRFEYFLTVMKNAAFIIGNSSAGLREAPYYAVPAVNVGTRQQGRSRNPDTIHTGYSLPSILEGIKKAQHAELVPQNLFGSGNSDVQFFSAIQKDFFWQTPKQKVFADMTGKDFQSEIK